MIIIAIALGILTTLIMWFFSDKDLENWWAYLIPVPLALIIGMGSIAIFSHIQASKIEYWVNYATAAAYFEPWNELVTYYVEVDDGTDSEGNHHSHMESRTRVDYHPAQWSMSDNQGTSYGIDQNFYEMLRVRWGNTTFVNMHRHYHTINGNQYYTSWNNIRKDIEVINSTHHYINKVAVSKSVFNFKDFSDKEVIAQRLIKYPECSMSDMPHILGAKTSQWVTANDNLAKFNATVGATHKIKIWVLVYKNEPEDIAFAQQSYWKNGNMNEFVICLGIDDKETLQWVDTFSWTPNMDLLVKSKNDMGANVGKKLDLQGVVNYTESDIVHQWQKRNFKKDFAYISVDLPLWATIISIVLTVLGQFGITMFYLTVENDKGHLHDFQSSGRLYFGRKGRFAGQKQDYRIKPQSRLSYR